MSMPRADQIADGGPPTPRRSALTQTRSRETRRRLIRAALELWNERGFEDAFEATTAEEIARTAGVSRGTFYFHFAHKDDVLLEMSWATGELLAEEAEAGMGRDVPAFDLATQLMTSLARRVARAPRAAVSRATQHWARLGHGPRERLDPRSFRAAFRTLVVYAGERGDLPSDIDVDELAALLEAATMDALAGWALGDEAPAALRRRLCRRADIILHGAAATAPG
jgi:AcrR family transcriptional regulator